MKKLSFDESRAIMLEILKAFDRLCHEHDLEYHIAYGTLIGAMRHGGFIPWDDDIDVSMLRSEYDRLWEVLGGELFEGRYRLVGARDGSSIHAFGKFVDTRTVTFETFVDRSMPCSLWVDIFPAERLWTHDPRLLEVNLRCRLNEALGMIPISNPEVGASTAARIAKRALLPLGRFIDSQKIAHEQEELARSLNASPEVPESECRFAQLWWGYYEECSFPWETIYPLGKARFEDGEFPVPHDPDAVLTRAYGNWRWMPPEGERGFAHTTDTYLLEEGETLEDALESLR